MKFEGEMYTVLTKYTKPNGSEVVKAYGLFDDKSNCQTVKRQIIKDAAGVNLTATMVTVFPVRDRLHT